MYTFVNIAIFMSITQPCVISIVGLRHDDTTSIQFYYTIKYDHGYVPLVINTSRPFPHS